MTSMRSEQRSVFWPLILIGVGVVWLLSNAGILRASNLLILLQWWPLILIVIGAEILFRRSNPRMSFWVGAGGALLLLAVMLVGPTLGWVRTTEVNRFRFDEPLGDASSAEIHLNLSVADTKISALQDSTALIDANLSDYGTVTFNVSGATAKTVTLTSEGQQSVTTSWPFGFFGGMDDQAKWDVSLTDRVLLSLDISGGVGDSTVDLREINLRDLTLTGGVGNLDLDLPSMETSYDVAVTSGTGQMTVRIEDKAAVHLTINGGVGDVTVDVPEGAVVRVEASSGVGNINMPASYRRVSGNEDRFVGDSGVWESENFDQAATRQIIIRFEGGVGDFNLR